MWDVLRFLNLVCCGIVTGTYTFEMVVVIPAVNAAPTKLSAQIHRALFSHLPNRHMPPCGITGGLAAVALLTFGGDRVSPRAKQLYARGLLAWIPTFGILVGLSRPLDKKITGWVETTLPEDEYPAVRKQWDRLMYARGPLGLLGFSLFVAATLADRPQA